MTWIVSSDALGLYLHNNDTVKLAPDSQHLCYTLEELEDMETISEGQADDLKIHDGDYKIYLGRCGIADGEPFNNPVTVERYSHDTNRWEDIYRYEAI